MRRRLWRFSAIRRVNRIQPSARYASSEEASWYETRNHSDAGRFEVWAQVQKVVKPSGQCAKGARAVCSAVRVRAGQQRHVAGVCG